MRRTCMIRIIRTAQLAQFPCYIRFVLSFRSKPAMQTLLSSMCFTLALFTALPPCIGSAYIDLPTTDSAIAAQQAVVLQLPPLPFLYQISEEPLYLNFTAYGPPISRTDGNLFMYNITVFLLLQARNHFSVFPNVWQDAVRRSPPSTDRA